MVTFVPSLEFYRLREWVSVYFPENMEKYTLSLKGEKILRIFSPNAKNVFEYEFSSMYDRSLVVYELVRRGIDLAPTVGMEMNLARLRKYQIAGLRARKGVDKFAQEKEAEE